MTARSRLEVSAQSTPMVEVFTPQGMEEMGVNMKDLFSQIMPKKTKRRSVKIPEAMELLTQEEAARLVDMDQVAHEAIHARGAVGNRVHRRDRQDCRTRSPAAAVPTSPARACSATCCRSSRAPRSTPSTASVRTDHILFVASGAFHISKPSDLIPEFQGRFPIRVELKALTRDDFVRILTEPENALIKQYVALLKTEQVELCFSEDAVLALAEIAAAVNARSENIGARRLHTVLERVLDELSFTAPELTERQVAIDAAYVHQRLDPIIKDEDLSRYIL